MSISGQLIGLERFSLTGTQVVELKTPDTLATSNDTTPSDKIRQLSGFLFLTARQCKPTMRLFAQKLKSMILWARRWHHCYKMNLKLPRYVSHAVVEFPPHVIFYFSIKTIRVIQRRREKLCQWLKSSNQLKATFDVLEPCIMKIRERFPIKGQRQILTLLQDRAMK